MTYTQSELDDVKTVVKILMTEWLEDLDQDEREDNILFYEDIIKTLKPLCKEGDSSIEWVNQCYNNTYIMKRYTGNPLYSDTQKKYRLNVEKYMDSLPFNILQNEEVIIGLFMFFKNMMK